MTQESSDRIYQAENLRVNGKLSQAMWEVRDALIDPTSIEGKSDDELSDLIRKWRIYTVAGMSLAREKWLAVNARKALLLTKPIFETYYFHPVVEGRSPGFLEDNEGHLYDHRAEMLRDIGKYYLLAFNVSGDLHFLAQSTANFERAIGEAVLDGPRGIAMIELGQIRKFSNSLNHRPPGSIYQTYVHEGYELAIPGAIDESNEDRIKWILINTRYEANHFLSERQKPNLSYHIQREVAQVDIESIDDLMKKKYGGDIEVRKILSEHEGKIISFQHHALAWRLTRFGVDFSGLRLAAS